MIASPSVPIAIDGAKPTLFAVSTEVCVAVVHATLSQCDTRRSPGDAVCAIIANPSAPIAIDGLEPTKLVVSTELLVDTEHVTLLQCVTRKSLVIGARWAMIANLPLGER